MKVTLVLQKVFKLPGTWEIMVRTPKDQLRMKIYLSNFILSMIEDLMGQHQTCSLHLKKQRSQKKRGLGPSRKPEHCSDSREGPSPLLSFINVLQDISHKRKLSCVSSLNQRGGFLLSSRGAPSPLPLPIPYC